MEIGPFVACAGFRNPALLAKMAVTLDEVSGGRAILGGRQPPGPGLELDHVAPVVPGERGLRQLDDGLHEVARTLRIAPRSVQRIQRRTLDIDQARELADRFGVRVKDLWPELANVDRQLHGVDWSADAACKGADLNVFFPSQDGPYSNEAAYTLAASYCERCPVRQTCLEEALFIEERGGQEPHGFVGGKRPMERRALLRFRRDAATHQIKKAV